MRNELFYMKVFGLYCLIKVFFCFLYKLGLDENVYVLFCEKFNIDVEK